MTNGLRGDDPGEWGHSLANLQEVLVAALEVAGARSVAEIGAYAGDLTRDLADWAEPRGGSVTAVDPFPEPALTRLAEERGSVTLVEEASFDALGHIPRTDAVVIDGDHNYYTVGRELHALAERFTGDEFPLLLLHDVRWPHARRDAYYAPEALPEQERHPMKSGPVFPGVSGLAPGGLPYKNVAAEEGGPRNGVLTALDDFLVEREDLTVAVVPAFYGLGIVWPSVAPWSAEMSALLEPWDRVPWLERLEQHRVYNLARFYREKMKLEWEIERLRAVNQHKTEMLEQLGASRAFKLGDRLSHLRRRNGISWREQLDELIRER
jgi:Methyltransferase domain